MALRAGDRISSWEVIRPIGAGGMGSVYLCRDSLGEHLSAAVKVNDVRGVEGHRRFMREVEALAAVQHPGIVALLGWGEDSEHGVLWFAMDFLEGDNLEDRLARGPMSLDEALPIFSLVARALQHAAAHGISHRDVKPANIVLTPEGARLVDFGIAIQEDRTRLTVYDQVPGTPLYMAPEVFAGDEPDARLGDVYALGLILHECLTGAPAMTLPDSLSDQQRFARVVTAKLTAEALDPGPEFPPGVREVVRRSTDPEPSTRLADWDEFVELLEGRSPPAAPPARAAWIRPVIAAGAVAVALAGLLAVGVGAGALALWSRAESAALPEPVVEATPVEDEPALAPSEAQPPGEDVEEAPAEIVAEEPGIEVERPVPVPGPEPARVIEEPGTADAEPGPGEILLTATGGAPAIVRVADIVMAQRDGLDTRLATVGGEVRCEQTITDLDGIIVDAAIIRVHRDYLVNARFVTALEADEAGHWATTRAGRVPVGALQADTLRAAAGL